MVLKKFIPIILGLLLVGNLTYAQRNCASMEVLEQQIENDPKRADELKKIENQIQHFVNNPDSRVVNGVVTIPVVVHVVWNTSAENISDAQILSQITVLTEDFRRLNADQDASWPQAADTEIEFCLASVDPNGNPTTGITRTQTSVSSWNTNDQMKFTSSGGRDAWPRSDYLNIWVVDLCCGILGYAQFPGGPASTDGIVCDYQYFGTIGTATPPFNLGRTGTHEVGHWLNLRHIWGDGGCGVDDFVSDTPTSDNPNYGCPIGHVSCGTTDMVQNYMDYTDDACMNLYTNGQKTRMQALFNPGGFRNSLLSSPGCGNSNPPTCNDGIQNGNETGVDCGGPDCPACPTCNDGIQNGNETGVDCGGPDCPACPCTGTAVTYTLNLDNYPEETTWELVNSNGQTIESGGPYGSVPDGSTLTFDWCLADGCYDFTIFDSYGDGICCGYGNGSYTIVDEFGNTLASGGNFGSSETTNFCLPVGGGATCNDGIQNGNETGVDCGGPDCPACPTCNDGIQNGNETGIDCGGPDCPPCGGGGCTYANYDLETFEAGWGIWNDGGSDARRFANSFPASSGIYTIQLRDNTNSSVMTTDPIPTGGYDEIEVSFHYMGRSMEPGEDFWLQIDTGNGFTTVATYVSGTDFTNLTGYFTTVTIPGPFPATSRLRIRCDASANNDQVYIDDVQIDGCVNGTRVIIDGEEPAMLDELTITPQELEMLVFPNPTRDLLNVNYFMPQEGEVQLLLTDLNGRRVQYRQLSAAAGEQVEELDLSELAAGVYFIHLYSENGRATERVVVVR
jgi:hypothetical protein